jgi:hypothetical protein
MYAISTDYNNNLDLNGDYLDGAVSYDYEHYNKSIWVKPYTSFERLNLKHGPKVDMISYGTIVGGDSDFRKLKNGWSNVGSLYIGYNGTQMDYDHIDLTTNGGLLGITESFYKNNFFAAITAQAGASFVEAHGPYGKEDTTMIFGGVAGKTGYNFEFKNGKYILQPNVMMNWSMVQALDYTSASGVRMKPEALNTIQLAPTLRFIMNLENGWQPYASIGMVWNLMNDGSVKARDTKIPQTHAKSYLEYGVGVQKHISDKFSGYGQVMVRHGGRTGVALTVGFRWAIGMNLKSLKKKKKQDKVDAQIKNINNLNNVQQPTIRGSEPEIKINPVEPIIVPSESTNSVELNKVMEQIESGSSGGAAGFTGKTVIKGDSESVKPVGAKTVKSSKNTNIQRYLDLIGE